MYYSINEITMRYINDASMRLLEILINDMQFLSHVEY